jgi:hypothetical protein
MTRGTNRCAYCGRAATTRDHVPSRKFFPAPRPSDLITVPCCGRCNQGFSDDEEYFLIRVLANASVRGPEAAAVLRQRFSAVWTPRRIRAIEKLVTETTSVAVHSPAGVYLGHAPGFEMDLAPCRRVVEKIVRGLYFHEFGHRVPAGMLVVGLFEPDPTVLQHPVAQALLQTAPRIRGGTVFEYRTQCSQDNEDAALFFMLFFGGVLAIGAVVSHAHAEELRRRRPTRG